MATPQKKSPQPSSTVKKAPTITKKSASQSSSAVKKAPQKLAPKVVKETQPNVKKVSSKPASKVTKSQPASLKTKPISSAALNLPPKLFAIKPNPQTIFDAIMSERASLRQGTHAVKSKAQVRGGGRKPFAQKGTSRARAGSIRLPHWVGGGVAWGPTPQKNYQLKVNRKVKKLAFASALTLKAKADAVVIHDFTSIKDKPSTKAVLSELTSLPLKKSFSKILIVTNDALVWKSTANLQRVFATRLTSLTVEAIVNAHVLIFASDVIKELKGAS